MKTPGEFAIYETQHWSLGHRVDSALPGYLMLGSKIDTNNLADLPAEALTSLGPMLARGQDALRRLFEPKRIYIGRYGHMPGYPIHFHLIPIYDWVERLFWQDARYRSLELFAEPSDEAGTDGADLTLFVWREFCERPVPPAGEGPSVSEAIVMLRAAFEPLETN
ncbi:HIT family protein [Ensifer sp. 4252]|uniref:HIT family protein n=1 Tax=Ensifer sp. 4252 TaxID=3373915 RepID=UPI003D1B616B